MATTYTVKKGDTLWGIATTYASTISGSNTQAKVQTLVKLNDITDPDYIVVGQVLKLDGTSSGSAVSKTSRATIKAFGLQSNTDRTIYATWTWTKSNTENYRVVWYYDTGDGVWFIGNDSTETNKQCTYNAPSNAKRVKFKVKPISKKRTVNKKETSYWTANWSTEKSYSFSSNPPSTPPVPTVSIKSYTLTATLDNLDVNATGIQFQIVKNNTSVFKTGNVTIKTAHASYSCTVQAGADYKVRCRSYKGKVYSEWSDYSANSTTAPAATEGITVCKATSETSVYLEWTAVKSAKTYEIQYTTETRYFEGSDQIQSITGIESNKYEKTGLEPGDEYFFRVRVTNDNGNSSWSEIASIIIGTTPSMPTTWSSSTTVATGEALNLYWVHNSEDASSQTYAELEIYIDGAKETHTIENTRAEEEKDKTSVYTIDTSEFVEGTVIQWRVRTAGITKEYGEWSTQRTIDVYAPPTLELVLVDVNDDAIETLEAFPFYISGLAGPNTQAPISYHVSITANDSYQTVDELGNEKHVNSGDAVYSKYFDITDALFLEMSANNIDLENNVDYTVTCVVSMDSGLTAESSVQFTVSWVDLEYEPNAEISIDEETYTASIRPYCENESGVLIEDVVLSVYRREFDGSFTELATNIVNSSDTFITDPHPALDYARYRIVAISTVNGAVSYCDLPGYPVGGTAIIIQWDEDWTSFNSVNEDALDHPIWSGSMLKLPYNIDISNSHKSDSALVKYIGRSHPVSYYGTQEGDSSTWNAVIEKSDNETLYAIRRLAKWMGNVYVREPSGTGYWASVTVSYSIKHSDLSIPVSLNVTRVEGGM